MSRNSAIPEPSRILVTRLRYLGDIILTTPVVSALAGAFPGAEIDYLCESPYDQALIGNPHLHDRIVIKREEGGPGIGGFELLRRIRGNYDVVIDLFSNPRSAMLTGLSGAKLRLGGGKPPRSWVYNRHPAVGPSPFEESAVGHHMRFAESICGAVAPSDPRVYISPEEVREGRRILDDRGLGKESIALLTGGSWSTREWPAGHFVRLAAQIRMAGEQQPFFIGQPGKRERLDELRRLSHSQVSILPECGVRTLAGVLMNVRALVTNDGGIMHLAIACGIPTLAIFGSTEPRIWFPYEHLKHAMLAIETASCRPCHLPECPDPFCLTGLDPERVFDKLQALLAVNPA